MTNQKGTVLLFALLLTAIAAMLSSFLIAKRQTDIHRSQLILNHARGYWLSQGILSEAKQYLNQSQQQKRGVTVLPPITLSSQVITGELIDGQGRFNLNRLGEINQQIEFYRFVHKVIPTLPLAKIKELARHSFQRITGGTNQQQQGTKKHLRPFVDLSQWRLVAGVTQGIYQRLAPYLIALDANSPININAASLPVLMSLGLSQVDAERVIIFRRQQGGFKTVNAFVSWPPLVKYHLNIKELTVHSQFYLLRASCAQGGSTLHFTWLLHFAVKPSNSRIKVVWQQQL